MKIKFISLLLACIIIIMTLSLLGCNDGSDTVKNGKYLKLVNKSHAVDADYVPEDLVALDNTYTAGGKDIQLEATVAVAVKRLIDDMRESGIKNVTVTSGYRTYEYQKTLFDRYFTDEQTAHPTWSDDQIKDKVLTYSAYPGTSEHQTGLCVDLITDEMVGLWNWGSETPDNPYDKGFAETEAFEWLCENAYKYGFILRFPEDKTDITGYSYESWHYRYVGVEHATKIYDAGITLEEYLQD